MLEAICFQTLDVLRAMAADAGAAPLRVLFVDGGASQNALLLQMQADLLQVRAPCGRTAAPRCRSRRWLGTPRLRRGCDFVHVT